MRTEVILHRDCEPSYREWCDVMRRRCEGSAVSLEMLYTELLDQLRTSASKPEGAKVEAKKSGGGEIWYRSYYPLTRVRYLIRTAGIGWASPPGVSFCCVSGLYVPVNCLDLLFTEAVVEVQVVRDGHAEVLGDIAG